jgi:glucose/arabinose dehydrogenase
MRLRPLLLIALAACSSSTVVTSATSTTAATTTALATTTTAPATTTTTLPPTTTTTLAPLQSLELQLVTEGLTQPVLLISPPDDPRRFVAERTGVVWVLDENGVQLEEPFLDLRDRVNSGGIEQGFLGMAFHPSFADNGRFFAY